MTNIDLTLKRYLIIAALVRGIDRKEICRTVVCDNSYITKTMQDYQYTFVFNKFKNLPPDEDARTFKGIGTLFMDTGRLFYSEGQIING